MDESNRREPDPLQSCIRLRCIGRLSALASARLASLFVFSLTLELAGAQTVPSDAAAVAASHRGALAETVSGMVRFTRWPQDAKDMRLCVLGTGGSADELLRPGAVGTAERSLAAQPVSLSEDSLGDCQVIYLSGPITATTRNQILKSTGRPVLTIAEGQDSCSDGVMFCLDPASRRFSVNLDAVARSGLRVNPQVLRLARTNPRAGS